VPESLSARPGFRKEMPLSGIFGVVAELICHG
jgi:hypothetical protein